jgi:hypothetical protein
MEVVWGLHVGILCWMRRVYATNQGKLIGVNSRKNSIWVFLSADPLRTYLTPLYPISPRYLREYLGYPQSQFGWVLIDDLDDDAEGKVVAKSNLFQESRRIATLS